MLLPRSSLRDKIHRDKGAGARCSSNGRSVGCSGGQGLLHSLEDAVIHGVSSSAHEPPLCNTCTNLPSSFKGGLFPCGRFGFLEFPYMIIQWSKNPGIGPPKDPASGLHWPSFPGFVVPRFTMADRTAQPGRPIPKSTRLPSLNVTCALRQRTPLCLAEEYTRMNWAG